MVSRPIVPPSQEGEMDSFHPNQDGLAQLFETGRPLTADELTPFGIEFVESPARLPELRQRYGLPNVVDIGHGPFGAKVGLTFVDDDTGRVVAYVPPEVSLALHEAMLEQLAKEQAEEEALAVATAAAAHTLLPPEAIAALPPLYTNEALGEDAIAHLKLFCPWSNWTWYASELDPKERLCFGVVVGHEREYGYFSIAELEALRGPGGLQIERDLHWTPQPLKDCR
jgi:hypothetical protein